MRRDARWTLAVALAGSLLLHAVVLTQPVWRAPSDLPLAPPPLQVQLVNAPATPPTAPPATAARPLARKPASPPLLPAAVRPPQPESLPVAPPPAEPAPQVADVGAQVLPAPPVPPEPPQPDLSQPDLSQPDLPPRLDLRYSVHYGVVSGEQTLVWVYDGARYTLTSVAAARGVAGLFYRGQFVQTSRGRVTPGGLVPEEFWDQRGVKHSEARFDVAAGQATLTGVGAPRHFAFHGEVQDALSLFFQLALDAPDGPFAYTVFNGRKLREYRYALRGEETLDTALGPLRTLHLARIDSEDGRFEAWLALDYRYLPVRIVRADEAGRTVELQIREFQLQP